MGLFTDGFKLLKKASEPLYKTPKSIQETIEIMAVAENGIFEVSRNKYSKCYRFQDINYTTATEDEQIGIFERYCKFLNSLDCNYKITINNKNKNMEDLRDKVLITEKNDGFNNYRRIYNDIIEEKIIEGRQGIEQERYLTITIERKNFEEAKAQFATLEATIHKAFIELGAEIVPLNGNERLKVLYDYYHLGDEGSFDFDIKKAKKVGADFKNDLCNGMVKYFPDHFEDESKYCKALFIKKYPSSLSDRFINEITSLPVHSITSIDVVPVPKDLTTKVLQKKYLGIESDIIKQQRVRNKNNDFSTEISYAKRTEKKEIEAIMDDVRENDQCLFFVGVTIILMAESKKELESVCETVETIGKRNSCTIDTHYLKQREALNTALPIGVRQVETMRTLLTQSLAVLMPFNVQELNDSTGNYYGINQISKNVNIGNRKKLINGNGFVFGVPGSGKSFFCKMEIESMKEQHEQAVKSFEEYLEKIRPTMITKEGTACMDAIDKAWAEYKEVDAKVIEVGATTDTAKSLQAQRMMTDEAAPKYQALDDALQKLMALNISLGNAKRAQLRTVMIAALTIIIIVIAVSTIYSNSLSVAISKSIEKPLNELKDRFITFAEGDIDSPLPTVESEDEIKELVSGVSAMSDRIRVIIKDSGRMLNEMSEGNFAIDTECEEVYTGAFTDLLTGIRKMNEEIDTTVRGVDDASGQVLTGSTNLAEAAQSLAEGATDQAASVEEMQATINELTSGIKTTAEELGTAYDEAYKYAEIAEGSRGDMEVLVQAMSRINETSEKIGAIITQIEDIASQTNLLSLNASIEAARAGEAGKGFAVVADQIRNLAEQSAKSAVDSKALIEAAIHEVGDGNMYAEKASTSLREVVDGIQAIADSAKKIKEISIEQADSMEQVEATAERIAEVVQNNSAAAQETSATSEELTAQATTLSGMVSVFKLRQ